MNLSKVARESIRFYFKDKLFEPDSKTKKRYSKKGASFITLTLNGELRGCIGTLPFEKDKELWKDVRDNSISAAFKDPRFRPLNKKEFENIKIEISILSEPKKLTTQKTESILDEINSNMGIILKRGKNISTFLPQVWEKISNKRKFLEKLSIKAGLNKDAWEDSETELWFYTVKKI